MVRGDNSLADIARDLLHHGNHRILLLLLKDLLTPLRKLQLCVFILEDFALHTVVLLKPPKEDLLRLRRTHIQILVRFVLAKSEHMRLLDLLMVQNLFQIFYFLNNVLIVLGYGSKIYLFIILMVN